MLPKSFDKPETKIVLAVAWIVVPCLFSLLGFYLGVVLGHQDPKIDLQAVDMAIGKQYAAVFFCISIVAAVIVTIVIPKVNDKDYATREAKWAARSEHHDH